MRNGDRARKREHKTIHIDEDVLLLLKKSREEFGKSFSQTVNDAVRDQYQMRSQFEMLCGDLAEIKALLESRLPK